MPRSHAPPGQRFQFLLIIPMLRLVTPLPQNLSFEERYVLADRLKAKGNELFKKQKFKFARARCACFACPLHADPLGALPSTSANSVCPCARGALL